MKQNSIQVIFICSLFLFFGCSPKAAFLFSKGTGSFEPYERERVEPSISVTQLVPPVAKAMPETESTTSDAINFTASVQPDLSGIDLPESKPVLPITIKFAEPGKAVTVREDKQLQKLKKVRKAVYKKLVQKPADDTKPVHKLAKIGFFISIASLALLLISTITFVPVIGLIALLGAIGGGITSFIALQEIKRNPEYSGRGKALAGFIIGLATLLLFLFYLVALLVVLASFQ